MIYTEKGTEPPKEAKKTSRTREGWQERGEKRQPGLEVLEEKPE